MAARDDGDLALAQLQPDVRLGFEKFRTDFHWPHLGHRDPEKLQKCCRQPLVDQDAPVLRVLAELDHIVAAVVAA